MKKSAELEATTTQEEKLDLIATYLERMDRRDKMRMWGGMIRSIIALIPIIFFLWSTWYVFMHFDDIISTVVQQTAEQAATTTGQNYDEIMKKIREAL